MSTLQGAVVGLDTMPVIYFIERNPKYVHIVRSFLQAVDRGEMTVVTSMVTLLEVLVHPVRQGDIALAEQYRNILLNSKGMTTLPVSQSIAEEGAKLRASYAIRTPDHPMRFKWRLRSRLAPSSS